MPNLLAEFRSLLPGSPLLVGDVLSIDGGVAIVELPDGSTISARGQATIGQRVFVRDGAIEGVAPALAAVAIEI
jgi:hypothetical protein